MTTNEDKLLAVARYLEEDMDNDERIGFEDSLAADEELQKLVAEYQNLHQTLKLHLAPSHVDLEVKEKLRNLNDQYFRKEKSAKIVPLFQYLSWGSIAAVLVIGLLIWAPWSVSLYDKYAISKEMSVAERGADSDNDLEKAAELYNQKNFSAAAQLLEKAYKKTPENSLVAYYYGISLIEINKLAEARIVLEKLYAGASVFKYDAAYYISLSYIKTDEKELAINWLSKIPEESNSYGNAKTLIQKLK